MGDWKEFQELFVSLDDEGRIEMLQILDEEIQKEINREIIQQLRDQLPDQNPDQT